MSRQIYPYFYIKQSERDEIIGPRFQSTSVKTLFFESGRSWHKQRRNVLTRVLKNEEVNKFQIYLYPGLSSHFIGSPHWLTGSPLCWPFFLHGGKAAAAGQYRMLLDSASGWVSFRTFSSSFIVFHWVFAHPQTSHCNQGHAMLWQSRAVVPFFGNRSWFPGRQFFHRRHGGRGGRGGQRKASWWFKSITFIILLLIW